MIGLQILKDIYTRPTEAFDKQRLEASVGEAAVWYVVLNLAFGIFTYFYVLAERFSSMSVPVRIGVIVITFPFVLFLSWSLNVATPKKAGMTYVRAYLSGLMWIGVALLPLTLTITLLPSLHLSWLSTIISAAFTVTCIRSIAGLDTNQSMWVLGKAALVLFAIGSMIVGIGVFTHMKGIL